MCSYDLVWYWQVTGLIWQENLDGFLSIFPKPLVKQEIYSPLLKVQKYTPFNPQQPTNYTETNPPDHHYNRVYADCVNSRVVRHAAFSYSCARERFIGAQAKQSAYSILPNKFHTVHQFYCLLNQPGSYPKKILIESRLHMSNKTII